MSAIAAQCTLDGVADGTTVIASTLTATGSTSGTGATWARNASGTPTWVTAGHGFKIITTTAGDIARIDATLTAASNAIRAQQRLTVPAAPTGATEVQHVRSASATMLAVIIYANRTLQLSAAGGLVAGSLTPAVAVGDDLLIDLVTALHSSPTTSNGRAFVRIRNLTDTSWNTTGEFFYDSGYTLNIGTAQATGVRFGKVNSVTMPSPGLTWQYLGVEGITVSTSDTSEAAAKAYLADAPTEPSTPLATPAPTATVTNVSAYAGSDGQIALSWPPVTDAATYEVAEGPTGSTTPGDFTVRATVATTSHTLTGRAAGASRFRVIANP